MIKNTTMNHVALQCSDRAAAQRFFTDVLDIPRQRSFSLSPETAQAIFGSPEEIQIDVYDNGLLKIEVFITASKQASTYTHVCLEVASKQTFITRCLHHNIQPLIIHKDNKELLFIKDFSGNLYEIKEQQ
jgi:catechol 2,3-dioxygenase-like lactoylglutathione lyase family enzyme